LAAGDAPATALVLIELHDAERELDHAGLIVEDDHAAGAQELAALGEGIEIHVDALGLLGIEQESRRSAGNDGCEFATVGNSAAEFVDQLLEGIAQGQFVYARLVDVAAQAEQPRAAVLGRTIVGELLATHENDVGNGGDALDIVDDRGSAPQADDSGE